MPQVDNHLRWCLKDPKRLMKTSQKFITYVKKSNNLLLRLVSRFF